MKNTLEIKVNGKAIRSYNHAGNVYVEGKEGTEYSISVKNNHYSRRLFVISVDGINVINGKKASEDSTTGYVINGYDSLDLKGFRINDTDVAAFKFVKSDESYAKNITGSSANAGVIGVKIYDEKHVTYTYTTDWYNWKHQQLYKESNGPWTGTPIPQQTWVTCDSNTNVGGSIQNAYYSNNVNCCSTQDSLSLSSTQKTDFNLGTGWGSKQTQSVTEVEFKMGNCVYTMIVYYASKKQLESMGVELGNKAKIIKQTMPSAFGEKKYCPIPKNWKG